MKTKILALIALSSILILSGCSNDSTVSETVNPVGSWGEMNGEVLNLDQPWISFANDGTLIASDGGENCPTFPGTWEQEDSLLTLRPQPNSVASCSDAKISSATEATVSEDTISLRDSRGNELIEVPFLSPNPGLHSEAISKRIGENASKVAEEIAKAESPIITEDVEDQKGDRF